MANELNKVNSSGIEDGSIVNADIKSDAAIALSKLASTPAVLTGSTNNQITTVTGANAIQGEANLTFDGTNLGIGTSTPSNPLEINQSSSTAYDASAVQDGGARLSIFNRVNTTSNTFADIHLKCHSTSSGEARMGMRLPSTSNSELFFITENSGTLAERMLIESNGDVKISDGDLVIGGTGHGIDFSNSQTPAGGMTNELLDHYEEGTFTATPADAASGGNTSSSTYTGYYTKIGRQVTLIVKMLNIDTTGLTASNDVYVQGIPFTSMSGPEAVGSSVVNANWSSSTTWVNSSILENDAFVRFHESADNASRDYVRWTEINDGTGDILWSLTYFTA